MRRDVGLGVLIAAAAGTYPAIALGWCVAMLLGAGGGAAAGELWRAGPGAWAAIVLALMAAIAVANATRCAVSALWQTRRFRAWARRRAAASPAVGPPAAASPSGPLPAVLEETGLRKRITVVDTDEPLAVTVGLLRPQVVLSAGLLAALKPAELRAVLAHEQAHLRARDPLRILLGRVLAAHLWFLPVAVDLRGRARRGYELAADRHAVRRCGRAATAGALLRMIAAPITVPAAAAAFADPEVLAARVAQLESGQPPRPPAISTLHAAVTVVGALAFLAAVLGAWLFMLVACPGTTGASMG